MKFEREILRGVAPVAALQVFSSSAAASSIAKRRSKPTRFDCLAVDSVAGLASGNAVGLCSSLCPLGGSRRFDP